MTKMKAMRDFRGKPGEGTTPALGDRFVEAGGEFTPQGHGRAVWLEAQGLAIPIGDDGVAPVTPREAVVQNEASVAGPLATPGGETGAEPAASSSPPDPAPAPPASPRRKATVRRSSSTKAGG